MPPKKKTKGKKNKASAGGADAADNAVEATSLLNWSYLNFKFRTKISTRLFAVKVSER
ncbi:uncharacterized protein PITG_06217 [Phytophthora infestans T30-4]|uniref:Uncharacterized protein n=1 Tax=Phytophthora infestans (strain T30-4) TaxID=403677 RepID=D0N4C4_PHYIT|nr:uncharacterized protein PITG_06217 [Phytophthora infestans T30-4]EEY69732.1 hypothetical protein PITG_06217 [Phytophthora infestans T30-4]|eukprot:XP_002998379.1 hypothetical protein PITG_06217 [Phytophthora infestans T30-4]